MDVRIAGFNNESIVDGSGIRYTVFFQGCKHNCIGCQNPETHDMTAGDLWDTQEIVEAIKLRDLCSGVTLSGGDPFFQPKAALEIATKVHEMGRNVWCYTGYTIEDLLKSKDTDKLSLLAEVDVLVDGRFELEHRTLDATFKGSSNQRIIDVKKTLESKEIVILDI